MEFLVKDRSIVTPGMAIAKGSFRYEYGVDKFEDTIISSVLGIVYIENDGVKVVPLEGKYMPKRGDDVIGTVVSINPLSWDLEINAPYLANLHVQDALRYVKDTSNLDRIFKVGDVIYANVKDVGESSDIVLQSKERPYGKMKWGRVVKIHATRVPRVIGKKGSMIKLLKQMSKCEIMVGQNGNIWIKGERQMEDIVERAILKIDKEAHIPGLTDRIKKILESELSK
mgnify:FL=1